jgi:hypothetical protein
MSSGDVWGILMALLAIVIPLGLAWLLMVWRERSRDSKAGLTGRHRR